MAKRTIFQDRVLGALASDDHCWIGVPDCTKDGKVRLALTEVYCGDLIANAINWAEQACTYELRRQVEFVYHSTVVHKDVSYFIIETLLTYTKELS